MTHLTSLGLGSAKITDASLQHLIRAIRVIRGCIGTVGDNLARPALEARRKGRKARTNAGAERGDFTVSVS
jgi:hypothetical protein